MFRRTLKEEAMGWNQKLPKGSIHTFFESKSAFRQAYSQEEGAKHNAFKH